MKRWNLLIALALLSSCAGIQRAADDVGEKGVDVAAGTGLGFLAWLIHPVGWVGAALASAGGAIGALLFGGGDTTVHEAPTSPWVGIAAIVAVVLILRAWAHWLPPLLEVLKRTVLGTPRALLGGRRELISKPNRFARRAD